MQDRKGKHRGIKLGLISAVVLATLGFLVVRICHTEVVEVAEMVDATEVADTIEDVKTYVTTDESTGKVEETTYTTSGGTTVDENGTEWRPFISVSLMTSEDTITCDAIAKAFFLGEISLEECEASLLVYQEKYKGDYQTTEFGAVLANEGYNSSVFSNYVCIYTASQTTKTVDAGIEKYAVQF